MKQLILLLTVLVLGFISINLFTASSILAPVDEEVIIPDSVQQIFERSCIECHHTNSKNKRAVKKLDFEKLNTFKTYQVVGKLVDIAEVVVNNEMPPRRFTKKYPEKALTYRDRQILVNWVNELTAQPRQAQITLDSQLEDLKTQIVTVLSENHKSSIAVLEFYNDSGDYTKLGRYVSEELKTRMYFTEGLKVKERHLINKLLLQNQFIPTDTITEESAMRLGKILEVDAIVYGNIEDLNSSIKVNSRVISTDSSRLTSEISVEIPKDEKVLALFSKIIDKPLDLSDQLVTSKPIKITPQKNPTAEKGGFTFEFIEAYVIDSSIICKLNVSNPGDNHQDFRMRAWFREEGNTVVIDDLENEYYISAAKYDAKLVSEMFNVHKTTKTIYAGTTLNLEVHFKSDNTSPKKAKKISAVKIISEIEPWFTVEFNNIPLKNN